MGYPGAYAPVISVAASGWVGEWTRGTHLVVDASNVADPTNPDDFYITDFSSRELAGQDLDVAAPGSWVVGPYQLNSGQTSSYYFLGGTSMASPHVAGIVALMAQKNAGLTAAQAELHLEAAAIPLPAGCRDIIDPNRGPTRICWGDDAIWFRSHHRRRSPRCHAFALTCLLADTHGPPLGGPFLSWQWTSPPGNGHGRKKRSERLPSTGSKCRMRCMTASYRGTSSPVDSPSMGVPITFAGQKGIWKPKCFERIPLSIRSTFEGPYATSSTRRWSAAVSIPGDQPESPGQSRSSRSVRNEDTADLSPGYPARHLPGGLAGDHRP